MYIYNNFQTAHSGLIDLSLQLVKVFLYHLIMSKEQCQGKEAYKIRKTEKNYCKCADTFDIDETIFQ